MRFALIDLLLAKLLALYLVDSCLKKNATNNKVTGPGSFDFYVWLISTVTTAILLAEDFWH